MDVIAQPLIHQEVTVSTLGSGEVQHPVLPNNNIKNVGLEVLITPETPKEIKPSATEKEVLAHSEKSTMVVKPPTQEENPPKHPEKIESSLSQQETPVQPTVEADATVLQQTTHSCSKTP